MKYYAITVAKMDWKNGMNTTKIIAGVCTEANKEKHFKEEIDVTTEIYPVETLFTVREDENTYSYLGKDGLIHTIECERVIMFDE